MLQYSEQGTFESVHYERMNPQVVLVDSAVIAEAPARFTPAFCADVGLPTALSDIGRRNADRDHLLKAAPRACAPEQPLHHEAGTVTPQMVLDAMRAVDAPDEAATGATRPQCSNH
jgi:glycerol dehydrogenase-like iron-containing ADH family enzyme